MRKFSRHSQLYEVYFRDQTIPCLGRPEENAADNNGARNGVFKREADRLAEHLRLVVVAGTVVGALLQGRHKTLGVTRARIFKLLRNLFQGINSASLSSLSLNF
jgi:hypothetical protein